MRAGTILAFTASMGLVACESFSAIMKNESASAIDVVVFQTDGRILRTQLPAGRSLLLRRPLAEIDRIEYSRGCRVTGAQLAAGLTMVGNGWASIPLVPCEGGAD